MSSKFMLTLVGFVGWSFLSMWWWQKSVLCACDDSPKASATIPAIGSEKSFLPYYFSGKGGQRFLVKGYWYQNEKPDATNDLGLYRAARLRDSLKLYFPASSFELSSVYIESSNPDKDYRGAIVETINSPLSDNAGSSVVKDGKLVVYFPTNSSQKTLDAKTEERIGEIIKIAGQTNKPLLITGHTDSQGDAASNKVLGMKRAEQLKLLLIKRGVPGSKMRVISLGEDQPLSSNTTSEGRAANRRAELTIQQ
jgi:outer membrane protein OmpA-like peptidoglycan-associated protein